MSIKYDIKIFFHKFQYYIFLNFYFNFLIFITKNYMYSNNAYIILKIKIILL